MPEQSFRDCVKKAHWFPVHTGSIGVDQVPPSLRIQSETDPFLFEVFVLSQVYMIAL